ncbi:hypothetical protein R1sor_000959 [Riccia sorocarpa]|uniref:RING-type domain-containing protein n=1 Tax=Riccia sorocarpa TaxID=122646 RepID=A0ABD3GUL0_9MARC
MDPATSEVQEGDIPVAVDWVPPSSAVDDVTMDDTSVDVRVASLPASDHEVEDGEILDEAMDVLDSQSGVPPTLEAATTHVLIEDIPVAAVQAPMTSVVAEVTMGENLVDDGGASDRTYDHEIGKGQSILEVVPRTLQAATVEKLVEDNPVVAVVAPPTSADAEMTMGEIPVEVGGASEPAYDREVDKGQIITEAVPTTSKATTVEVGIADIPVAAVQAPPTSVVAEVTMGESVVVHGGASEPTYDHEVVKRQLFPEAIPTTLEGQETAPSSLADSTINPERFQELLHNIRSTRNDPHPIAEDITPTKIQDVQQAVPTPGTTANLDKVVLGVSDYLPIVSPDVTQNARESSGISNDREMLKVLNNFCEAVPLEQDLQTSVSLVESDTPVNTCSRPESGFRTSIGGRKDGFRAKVRKNFLFFAGLEKHGLKVDWTTVDKSRNVREISAADRHAARVELWKRKTVFRGSLLYPEEPKLRYDERVPRKPRRKRTSRASSTPEGNETSPGTKKPTKRKLNLNPPKSRSPSPEVPRRIQPGRKARANLQVNCDELNFLVTRNEKPVYPTDYDDFLEARKFGLKGSQWEKYAGVIRYDLEVKCPVCQDYIGLLPHICPGTCACKYHIGCFWPAASRRSVCTVCKVPFASKTYEYAGVIRYDLEVKCPVCQDYIGLLPHICPGTCACKYHIGCFWPAASRRSVCTVCKVPFASKTYEFFNTRHIPPASKGSINPDTGELELDADQALDNEIHADVMAGRRDSFGPNNVDRAHMTSQKLRCEVPYWVYEDGRSVPPRSLLEHTHNRLVQELEEEGRNSGLEESYIEHMVSVFNDHINKTGDKNVKPMVYLRDWEENADAAGPSYQPMEISSEHDDDENDETYKPTA